MKKIINNIKTYFEYRKNRRYVKMEIMKYKVKALEFANDIIKNKGEAKIGQYKLNDIKNNIGEFMTLLNHNTQVMKGE